MAISNLQNLYTQLSGNYPDIYYDISTNSYLLDGNEFPANQFESTGDINYVRHKNSGKIFSVVPFD